MHLFPCQPQFSRLTIVAFRLLSPLHDAKPAGAACESASALTSFEE